MEKKKTIFVGKRLPKKRTEQTREEKAVFKRICEKLKGWEPEAEFDDRLGWIILAGKSINQNYLLRRIKPALVNKEWQEVSAIQNELKNQLVEVWPYTLKKDESRHMGEIKVLKHWSYAG